MTDEELCLRSACELSAELRRGSVSAREVVEAHLRRIERVDPEIGAICTLVPEKAIERAEELDRSQVERGPLHGLPIAIKDLVPTRGIRTTMGSPVFADDVPDASAHFVDRLEAAGAVVIGKTNTPEFGAGSQTFNEVFGATRNPWDTSRTCGGSSGGAASALAANLLPIADGSDYGGSLRNPASFCGVVGFRPTPGRVSRTPTRDLWDDMAVTGPMGRSVEDLALLFSVMAGPDPRDILTLPDASEGFYPTARLEATRKTGEPIKIAWSPDLGQHPVEPEVVRVCQSALTALTDLGIEIDEGHPDLSDAPEIFQTLRGAFYAGRLGAVVQRHRERVKDTVIWNVELGQSLSATDLVAAMHSRADLLDRVREFFEHYDYLALPTVQVLPFSIDCEYPTEINGQQLATYLDWMGTCTSITVTRCPSISVPAGTSREGMPVGLQLVAPSGEDRSLLALAAAFERSRPFPALPRL